MTDTPRTSLNAGFVSDSTPVHAQEFEYDASGDYVKVGFARILEREIQELERDNARVAKTVTF